MPIKQFLKDAEKFDIQIYKTSEESKDLHKTHIPFTGTPLRHPYDDNKLILVADPYSNNTFFHEFWVDDVTYAEEQPNLVNMDGVTLVMARLWVKKKSIGMRCTPFIVDDIRISQKDR